MRGALLHPGPKRRWSIYVAALLCACVATIALAGAVRWYGHPVPGLLVDPDLVVSSIGLPTWDGVRQGLAFPDRIVQVNDVDLRADHGAAARLWDRAVEDAFQRGDSGVRVVVETRTGRRELELALAPLEPVAWWLNAGATIFVGALYAAAAMFAMVFSPDGRLARTFAKAAFLSALFFFSYFDFHTTRSLVVGFYLAFATVPGAFIALALRLPDDAPLLRRFPWIVPVVDVAGLILAGVMISRRLAGDTTTALQQLSTVLMGAAFLFFVASLVIRFIRARGLRRNTLRALLLGMVPPHALIGIGLIVAMFSSRGSTAAFFFIPAFGLSPIATAVAVIRYDLWGSRALLSRLLTRVVAAVVTCALAVALGAAFAASLGAPFRTALVAAAAGGVAAAVLVHLVLRAVDKVVFPSLVQYKPTVEQLSEELTSISAPGEVAAAVERTVIRWLECERVEFRELADTEETQRKELSDEGVRVVARFGMKAIGEIHVGPKAGGALFTSADVDLLKTIANQAALALAYARNYAELERRRQTQAAAFQIERLTLVETVAAEIAHEVRYPINFFRSVFRKGPSRPALDAEEIEIGCEEVDRLERLVAGLRRVTGNRPEKRLIPMADLAARTEMLLRDALRGRELVLDIPEDAALRCDEDQTTQVLANLVSNALDATSSQGKVGVAWRRTDSGGELVVWDTGAGFEGDPSRLFAPWFTTKPRGTGLGLAITHRIVRAHGWTIDAVREGATTRFVIRVPAADVAAAPPRNVRAEVA
jgi:signal transduction histidine kinase